MLAQRRRISDVPRGDHDVANQLLLAGPILAHANSSLRHRGMAGQYHLHLPRLDAEPTDLDLVIGSAQKVQNSVCTPARQIAGAVKPCSR